jgi:hypothetical protein
LGLLVAPVASAPAGRKGCQRSRGRRLGALTRHDGLALGQQHAIHLQERLRLALRLECLCVLVVVLVVEVHLSVDGPQNLVDDALAPRNHHSRIGVQQPRKRLQRRELDEAHDAFVAKLLLDGEYGRGRCLDRSGAALDVVEALLEQLLAHGLCSSVCLVLLRLVRRHSGSGGRLLDHRCQRCSCRRLRRSEVALAHAEVDVAEPCVRAVQLLEVQAQAQADGAGVRRAGSELVATLERLLTVDLPAIGAVAVAQEVLVALGCGRLDAREAVERTRLVRNGKRLSHLADAHL